MSEMTYGQALCDALTTAMERDKSVFVMGIGADDHKELFGSVKGLVKKFGRARIFDTPLSEGAMTGIAIGAACAGMKPVHVHIRVDFTYLAMDQLFNIAAKWRAMFGGTMHIPMVVRAVIGRSWGQGAQHSQSLPSFFAHVPGLKVVMPTTPYDAKGLLLSAIFDPDPVVVIEHRILYYLKGEVPDGYYEVPLKKTFVRREGKDITVVANSYMVAEALQAAAFLSGKGIDVEVIDPVTLVPFDEEPVLQSIKKTKKLLVIDSSWTRCGISAEIASLAAEKAFFDLDQPVRRMGMAPAICPVSKPLENAFYPNAKSISTTICEMLGRRIPDTEAPMLQHSFKGPF